MEIHPENIAAEIKRCERMWTMGRMFVMGGMVLLAIVFPSCLQNPNSAPEINQDQIGSIKTELRLARYSAFMKNELDTLPKNISENDSATKALFQSEQVNAWLIISNFPKGVKATVVVGETETRGGKTTERPRAAVAEMNTCCLDDWNGNTWMQLQVPYWNRPGDVPYKLVYVAKINEHVILEDSITIF